MSELRSGDVCYRVQEYWPEDALQRARTPIFLLHGFTGSSESWTNLLPRFARPALAPDLLGHGQSDAPDDPVRYAMDTVATDLAALIERLVDRPVHLLGYSMGGRLALYFALTHPHLLRTLMLESASPGLADATAQSERRLADNALADAIEANGIEAFVARWEAVPLFASQQSLEARTRQQLRAQRLDNRAHGLANSLRGMGTGVQPSLWSSLHEVTMSTLLLAGELDEKFCHINRTMLRHLPDARLEVVADVGHTVHLEAPDRFCHLVNEFLQKEESKSTIHQ
jgi:2-succinyl-6-hydroxy-2,4-cyclohexadiene-1-carboxylate synthase